MSIVKYLKKHVSCDECSYFSAARLLTSCDECSYFSEICLCSF